MGYQIDAGGPITIPASKHADALQALRDAGLDAGTSDTLRSAIAGDDGSTATDWWPTFDQQTGDLIWLQYSGNQTGTEDDVLGALAPFVEPGGYIDFTGEDNEHWRHRFNGHTATQHAGKVVYPTDTYGQD